MYVVTIGRVDSHFHSYADAAYYVRVNNFGVVPKLNLSKD